MMAVSSIDYEKVDVQLLSMLQMLVSMEQMCVATKITNTAASSEFINAVDKFRNEVALEIEIQGAR